MSSPQQSGTNLSNKFHKNSRISLGNKASLGRLSNFRIDLSETTFQSQSAKTTSKTKLVGHRLHKMIRSQPAVIGSRPSTNQSVAEKFHPTTVNKNGCCARMPCSNKKLLENLRSIRVEVQLQYEGILKFMEWDERARDGNNLTLSSRSYSAAKIWIMYFTAKDTEAEVLDLINVLQTEYSEKLPGSLNIRDTKQSPLEFIDGVTSELLVTAEDMGCKNRKFYRALSRIKELFDNVLSSREKEISSGGVPSAARGTLCVGHTVGGLHDPIRPGCRRPKDKTWQLFGIKVQPLKDGFNEMIMTFKEIQIGLSQATEVLTNILAFSILPFHKTIRPALSWYKKYHKKVLGRNTLPTEDEKIIHDLIWGHILYIIRQGLLIYKEVSELVLINRLGYMLIKGKYELDPRLAKPTFFNDKSKEKRQSIKTSMDYSQVLQRKYHRKFSDLVEWVDFVVPNDFYNCPFPDTLRRLPIYMPSNDLLIGLFEHDMTSRKSDEQENRGKSK